MGASAPLTSMLADQATGSVQRIAPLMKEPSAPVRQASLVRSTGSRMKFTQYFEYIRERSDQRGIELEWIERLVTNPEHESLQSDGRIRRWGRVPEAAGKHLRVVLLEDGETVHNAFFDRSFRKEAR